MALEFAIFDEPPIIKGNLNGNWEHEDRMAFQGEVAVTNFYLKGVPYSDLKGTLAYTNKIVEGWKFLAHREDEEIRAPYLRVDIPREVMFVTNAVSTSNPWLAMSLVGDEVYKAIDPYRFDTPPIVKINGNVPLRHWSKADLHFQVGRDEFYLLEISFTECGWRCVLES